MLDTLLGAVDVAIHASVRTQFLSMAPSMLATIDFPAIVKPFRYKLVWHERSHKNRAMAWFRSQVVEVAKGLSFRIT